MVERGANARRRERRAKRLEPNLSQVPQEGLTEAIRRREADQWLKRNRAALDAYNEHVERDGVFSAGWHPF